MEISHGVKAMATLSTLRTYIFKETGMSGYYHESRTSHPMSGFEKVSGVARSILLSGPVVEVDRVRAE